MILQNQTVTVDAVAALPIKTNAEAAAIIEFFILLILIVKKKSQNRPWWFYHINRKLTGFSNETATALNSPQLPKVTNHKVAKLQEK